MTNADSELESWRRHWQTTAAVPPDLKGRVERETRRMRRFVVAGLIVTILFGGAGIAWAGLSQRLDALVLAIGIWAFIAIAWATSVLLRRDAWAPATLNTAAFLDLSILRCRRRREAVIAQSILYAMILAFDLAWIYFATPERAQQGGVLSFLTNSGVAWVWAVTGALGIWAVRHRQALARELAILTNLRQQLKDDFSPLEGETRTWHLPIKTVKRSGKKKWRGRLSAKN